MKLIKMCMVAGLTAALALGGTTVMAQPGGGGMGGMGGMGGGPGMGGGNFDPSQMEEMRAQMMERQLENVKEALNITNDTEWTAIKPLVTNVMAARMSSGGMGGGRMMGMGQRRNRGGNQDGNNDNANGNGQQRRNRGGMFGQDNAALEALQTAIESKDAAAIKTKLEAYRADVKAKEDKLTAAQEKLKAVLTPTQEAAAVAEGLLK
jgi:hypothetical protein